MTRSEQLFEEAARYIPGGVNSPLRSFVEMGQTPRFIRRADESRVYDVDGHVYIDFVCSGGAALLGHNPPLVRKAVLEAVQNGLNYEACAEAELKLAKLMVQLVPSVQMVRMVSSVTEAVLSAACVARSVTGRKHLIKFAGCCHGCFEAVESRESSSEVSFLCGCDQWALLAQYNDLSSVELLFEKNKGQVAAVMVEPLAAHMGIVEPEPGFLQGLRELCNQNGAILIFDETVTGFRLALGGAQEYYGVKPDMTVFGEIIGAGLPVGAYGGSRAIMEQLAPVGPVYQTDACNGNPVAMAAGFAQLSAVLAQPLLYENLAREGEKLRAGLRELFPQYTVSGVGSMNSLLFTAGPVKNASDARNSDKGQFVRYFSHMLENGIFIMPSQFKPIFVSGAHTERDVDLFLEASAEFLA
ncbi:glutamate-1-semialdehyde 2,1-aminomutase [Faecalispora anaeroviscerum]|uniref:glutamate-1-semialdehyde 2,1-aminomutase n=1 Tax=Faecalispora anaeroviscerum TaxID=2991836 RepID=UPI0024BBDCA8|nr:glutamate-1-semialdehyde 2,1-aminomutase [Faecalispora anaeroviscerum]